MMVLHIILLVAVALKTVSSTCSGSTNELTAEYDVVTNLFSDNYPYQYPNSQDCSWLITAANGSQNILLHIDSFFLEPSYDYLYIYDGNSSSSPLIWQQSGYYSNVFFMSSSENLYLRFMSDYSITYTGFYIQYMSVDRNSSAVSYSCDDTLTASTSFQQLSVIDDYDLAQSSLCSYTITSSVGTKLKFSVPIQDYSEVAVYDGTSVSTSLIIAYTRFNDHDNWYLSTSNNIYVVKPSGASFLMVYQEVDIAATVQSAAITTPTPAVDYACSSVTLEATSTPALIESPNYPSPYPNNAYCTGTFKAMDTSKSVQITFLDFDLSYCCDYVEIFDGYDSTYPSLGTAWYRGMNITSTGAALHGVFYTDGSGALSGFQIEYVQVDRVLPACVPDNATYLTASTSEQSIFSPNYPSYYDNNINTTWLITKPSETESIVLDIREMHIEHSTDCVYDSLTIYDGACTTSPILEVLCGTSTATIEHTSGLYILIQFTTDSSVTETGFELVYYMGAKGAEEASFYWEFIPYVVAGVVVLIIIISCIAYGRYRRLRATRQQVTPSVTATNGLVNPSQPRNVKYKKPLTTKELLLQLQGRYGSKEHDKKPKLKRRHTDMYSAQPGFSGQTNMGYHQSEHPPPYHPPPYSRGTGGDPAYPPPPNFFMVSANEAMIAPNPAMAPGSEPPPFKAQPVTEGSSSIPAASTYMTPSEARRAKALK